MIEGQDLAADSQLNGTGDGAGLLQLHVVPRLETVNELTFENVKGLWSAGVEVDLIKCDRPDRGELPDNGRDVIASTSEITMGVQAGKSLSGLTHVDNHSTMDKEVYSAPEQKRDIGESFKLHRQSFPDSTPNLPHPQPKVNPKAHVIQPKIRARLYYPGSFSQRDKHVRRPVRARILGRGVAEGLEWRSAMQEAGRRGMRRVHGWVASNALVERGEVCHVRGMATQGGLPQSPKAGQESRP